MVRKPRQKSKSGIYHVTIRGNNRQLIFYDDADRHYLLSKIQKVKSETGFELYAWCLMDNHVHLVIREKEVSISKIMQRVNGSFSMYMNKKHYGTGHTYEGRFYSKPIETILYLHTVIRYTHQNPVRSLITSLPSDYKWSSCRAYYQSDSLFAHLTDTKGILNYFSKDPLKAVLKFKRYTESVYDLPQKKSTSKPYYTDTEVLNLIQSKFPQINISQIKHLPVKERNEILKQLKKEFTANQISRIVGIAITIVWKA
ncbi:REP-associated tyrosine transposase [Jeotgalibacillus haloalkalitolerans]|uniref:Transposase n=1 Tax=Jeotgalibacillus haloalkalitolerans TaxID=3104292 RepID=A0ABU5KJT8_9BACL|nr:transposase [Jeotgalibacillus sp. HH7-29]MDZ5711404.1 transposase [Jeotgalibacillus sp. HH7-29]